MRNGENAVFKIEISFSQLLITKYKFNINRLSGLISKITFLYEISFIKKKSTGTPGNEINWCYLTIYTGEFSIVWMKFQFLEIFSLFIEARTWKHSGSTTGQSLKNRCSHHFYCLVFQININSAIFLHQKMIGILKTTAVDEQDIMVISELYWHQTTTVKIEQTTSEIICIRGVR